MSKPTGRILLRTEALIHLALLERAKARDLSLNEICSERIGIPSSLEGRQHQSLRAHLRMAEKLFQNDLLGFVLYGSQARNEAHSNSDWDLLLVVHERVPISRRIYREWDDLAPATHLPIEVHISHLPSDSKIATGFWSEIALDGIVLYEEKFCVSKYLGRIRREIASGVIVRKTLHGQAYWLHKEVA